MAAAARDALLVRYLLGAFPPGPGLEKLEEQLFNDDCLFDHLLSLEDALIDAHLRGLLQAPERRLFETVFLRSPRRRRKWESRRGEVERPSFSFRRLATFDAFAIAGATLVVVAGLAFAAVEFGRSERSIADLRSRIATLEGRPVAMPSVFVLAPGHQRSQGGSVVVVPDNRGVALYLTLSGEDPDSSLYDATLTTAEGETLWMERRLPRAAGNELRVDLPGALLRPADYVLSVCVEEKNGACRALPSYTFRVPRGS